MYEIVHVSLDRIHPNPFQTRSATRPEHVEKLAASILSLGLLEPPQAREMTRQPSHYQLVFGHTRFAAFELLHKRHPNDVRFAKLPLLPVRLDDQQMFESSISENLAREDISPIARARALQTYIRMFNATQTACGKLFSLSQGAVSNLIRLLNLPDAVIEIVDHGVLSERQARALLELQPHEAISVAQGATRREDGHRPAYVAERIRKIKARKRREDMGLPGTQPGHPSDTPLLAPEACPCCWKVPRNYVRGREGWRCGECSGAVKVSVVFAN
jgi:ParB family transcriptional regulator, chromosome partitioning protein